MLAFFASAALLLLPAILASLFLHPVDGDLVRIGHLPQRDFTAQAAQPVLETFADGAKSANADILVLGDSFSAANAWQSELTRITGRRTLTWHYDTVRCTGDWLEKALQGALRAGARTVIVQSIEREFLGRFEDRPGCARDYYPPADMSGEPVGEPRSPWSIFPIDIRHLGKTVAAYSRIHGTTGRLQSRKAVLVDLVRDDLFSHAQPRRLAYFADDEIKFNQWSAESAGRTLVQLRQWQHRADAADVQLFFLVIPDKSSVYWPHIEPAQRLPYPEKGEQLWALLGEQLGPAFDLLPFYRELALQQPDLYRPDDTHFSAAGYRHTAQAVAGWLSPPETARSAQ